MPQIQEQIVDGGNGNTGINPTAWVINPISKTMNWEESNGNIIFPSFQMKFNDLIINYPQFPDYKIIYFTDKPWVDLSGPVVDQTTKIITVNQDGINRLFTPIIVAGNTIQGGDHVIHITMRLYGVEGNEETILDEKTHTISLNYTALIQTVKLEKTIYEIVYVKSTGLFYGEKNLIIQNNTNNDNLSVIFNQVNSFLKTDVVNSNTGFTITGDSDVSLLANQISPYNISAKLVDALGNYVFGFVVNIKIIDNEDIVTYPEKLDFFLVISNANTETKNLELLNISNQLYTITIPSWLSSSTNGGNTSGNISISTVNSSTLSEGIYTDNITISYGTKNLVIPVILTVVNYISSEFSQNGHHFCLEGKKIKFYKKSIKGVFIKLKVKGYFKTPNNERNINISLQAVYFNDRCDFDIGEVINDYFYKERNNILNDEEVGNYKAKILYYPALIDIVAEELDDSYNILNTHTINTIKLYAGKRPLCFPFLTNNEVKSRIKSGKQIISYISGLVNPEDISSNLSNVNGVQDGVVVSVLLSDVNQLVLWPQKKTFIKSNSKITVYTRTSGPQTINIQWENQNLANESFNFSGEYQFLNDKVYTIDNNLKNKNLQKFSTMNYRKLSIDTGFILKSEIKAIDEFCDGLFCIIEINGKYYKGYVTTPKIIGEDSTNELINYNLEFTITNDKN